MEFRDTVAAIGLLLGPALGEGKDSEAVDCAATVV